MMETFKAAQLFNAGKVTDFKPTAVTVDSLKAFPFFGIGGNRLKSELAATDGILILFYFLCFYCYYALLC